MKIGRYAYEQLTKQYGMPFLTVDMDARVNKEAGRVTGISSAGVKGMPVNTKEVSCFHDTGQTIYYHENRSIIQGCRTK